MREARLRGYTPHPAIPHIPHRKDGPRMSGTSTPLENETRFETTSFDHFGRSWDVPMKRHLSHLKGLQAGMAQPYADPDVVCAEVLLGADQFAALMEINPSEPDLAEFVGEIAKAMGLGTSGNSVPSSTS